MLALVTAVLVAAMVSYLALAISLLQRDKIAYIYDLNSSLARTVSAEVEAALATLSDKAIFFAHETVAQPGEADALAAHFFAGETDLLALEVWQRQPSGVYRQRQRWLENKRLLGANIKDDNLARSRRDAPIPWDTVAESKVLVQNASVPPDLPLLSLAAATADKTTIVVATLRPNRLLRIFGRTEAYGAYLVDQRGTVLVHPDSRLIVAHENLLGRPLVRESLEGLPVRGVRPAAHDDGEKYIGAFARIPALGLTVITETPQSEALKTSRELIRSAILLAAVIFFAAVLISIFISRRLAAPLKELHRAAERIGAGDFHVSIAARSRDEVGDLARAVTKMAAELEARESRLQETHAQLVQSEKLAVLGAMSAEISHEIKNPLASIQGFAQLGESITSIEEARASFATIAAQTKRAKEILENVLRYTRQQPEQEPLQLNEIIQDTLRLIGPQLTANHVTLTTQLATDLPTIQGNAGQLQQVVLNLALNAVQAMPTAGTLTVRSELKQGQVRVQIVDTGPGIAAETKHQLFRPFFTTKPRGKGTGLGLSVSQNIVQQHRGALTLESEIGTGTTLTIEIPVSSAQ